MHRKTKIITIESIVICNNNLKLYWRLIANFTKEAQFSNKGGAEVSRIKEIINKLMIVFKFWFTKGHKTIMRPFIKDPDPYPIKICDRKVKC